MNSEKFFEKKIWMPGWGEIALSALQLALISGILLVPVFQAGEEAFGSLSRLIGSGFTGHLLHSFHSYCGDVFFFAAIIHTIEYLLKKSYKETAAKSWFILIALGIFSILAVFSGFLSIGSKESTAAGSIFISILKYFNVIGLSLTDFLIPPAEEGIIYIHHAASFTLLTVILTYVHIKRLKAESYAFYYTAVIILAVSMIFPADIGQPLSSPAEVIKGPWYFIGLQEMLAWLPVWLAGIFFPLLIVSLSALLPVIKNKERLLVYSLAVLFLFYIIESITGLFLRGAGWQFLWR